MLASKPECPECALRRRLRNLNGATTGRAGIRARLVGKRSVIDIGGTAERRRIVDDDATRSTGLGCRAGRSCAAVDRPARDIEAHHASIAQGAAATGRLSIAEDAQENVILAARIDLGQIESRRVIAVGVICAHRGPGVSGSTHHAGIDGNLEQCIVGWPRIADDVQMSCGTRGIAGREVFVIKRSGHQELVTWSNGCLSAVSGGEIRRKLEDSAARHVRAARRR